MRSDDYRKGFDAGQDFERERLAKSNLMIRVQDLITYDMSEIYDQQGCQPGMYGAYQDEADGLHTGEGTIERIIRTKISEYEDFPVRIYVLNCNGGGVCILGHENGYRREVEYTIFQLGEDDGFFFLKADGSAGFDYLNKVNFIDYMSRAISLLNNVK